MSTVEAKKSHDDRYVGDALSYFEVSLSGVKDLLSRTLELDGCEACLNCLLLRRASLRHTTYRGSRVSNEQEVSNELRGPIRQS